MADQFSRMAWPKRDWFRGFNVKREGITAPYKSDGTDAAVYCWPLIPDRTACSAHGIVHSGMVAALVDSSTSLHLSVSHAIRIHVSIFLHVRSIAPLPLHRHCVLHTSVDRVGRNIAFLTAKIVDATDSSLIFFTAEHLKYIYRQMRPSGGLVKSAPTNASTEMRRTSISSSSKELNSRRSAPTLSGENHGDSSLPPSLTATRTGEGTVVPSGKTTSPPNLLVAIRSLVAKYAQLHPHYQNWFADCGLQTEKIAEHSTSNGTCVSWPIVILPPCKNALNTLHGGVACILLDTLSSLHIEALSDSPPALTTVDSHVTFVKGAPLNEPCVIRTWVTLQSDSLIFTRSELRSCQRADTLFVYATHTMLPMQRFLRQTEVPLLRSSKL